MPNEDGKETDAKDQGTPPPTPPAPSDEGDGDEDNKPKLSPEQQKAFDKLLGKNGKLKSELDSAKTREDALKAELAAIKAEKDAAEADKLKQQGEFKTLYEKEAQKTEAVKSRLVEAEIKRLAQLEGIIDSDLVALISKDQVKVGDDFTINGAAAAVKAFKAEKPTLFRSPDDPTKPKESGAQVPPPPPTTPNSEKTRAENHKLGSPEYEADRAKFLAEK